MNTESIRAEIAAAIDHEKRTGTLARIVQTALQKREAGLSGEGLSAKTQRVVGSIRAFVESMPDVIEVTLASAERAGVAERMRPIFETAMSYVGESVDFIPDSLGLGGLVDDAYLVHGLMQEISQRHEMLAGTPLLPARYFAESQRIRRMIGEPTATRLDVAVVAFARRQNIRDTVDQIVQRIGGRGLSIDLPSMSRPVEPMDEVPELELGSLGG